VENWKERLLAPTKVKLSQVFENQDLHFNIQVCNQKISDQDLHFNIQVCNQKISDQELQEDKKTNEKKDEEIIKIDS
jgi:hypothetical protein